MHYPYDIDTIPCQTGLRLNSAREAWKSTGPCPFFVSAFVLQVQVESVLCA